MLLNATPQTAKPKKVKGICHRTKFMLACMNECALKITYHDKGASIDTQVAHTNAMFFVRRSAEEFASAWKSTTIDMARKTEIR